MAKHPGQSCHGVSAEAGAFKSRPAHGVGDQRGGDTKGQPGALNGRHGVVGMVLANGLVNSIDKGAHKGGGFCKDHGVSRPSMLHKLMRMDGGF
jgi:hypothetical protein